MGLELLDVPPASREWILVCDETCFFPNADLVVGLRKDMGYIGGFFSADVEQDKSFMSWEVMKHSSDEDLARLCQHYLISRCNSSSQSYCVDILPRPGKSVGIIANGADYTFREMGNCLLQGCSANGAPPISIAYDAGTAHTLLNRAMLGLVSSKVLQEAKFFRDCKIDRVHLPCFDFGVLVYLNKWNVLGCLDVWHVLKRFGFHLGTAGRTLPANLCKECGIVNGCVGIVGLHGADMDRYG